MNRILTCLAIALAVGACEPRGGAPAAPPAAPASSGPASIQYQTPTGAQTYVLPSTENACAPDPQRFVSVIGEVTYRVKDCVKDEWDYYPEAQRRRIDALVKQCQAKCAAAAPAPAATPAPPPATAPAAAPAKR
ncbi:MAG: hypothetical protein JO055_16255 [Alphaproteobacteria bacterium]|nr:hypothetical protein [Alphaproteobacteria bacterium]